MLGILPSAVLASQSEAVAQQEKPNFVFFMAEDLARESFSLYNGHAARTPELEKLAADGIVFNNAYSCAPVSSAARSSLITGCYAPSMGLSWHRKIEQVELPQDMHLFPYYLRQAGYFTSNGFKTDYNCRMEKGAWSLMKAEMDGWRNRPEGAPFFHCFTTNKCHESSLHFPEADKDTLKTGHDPSAVHLYPSHPDTELFRYTYARHYDEISAIDQMLGQMMTQLEEDKLLDDTFVFFMGDNGGCLPGTKGYMSERGLNVPLVVYVPENWKHLVPVSKGERSNAIVSFLDLAPTLLHLAGIPLPDHLDGTPFMGKDIGGSDLECMDEVYCYGDRFDEMYAMTRTVRKMDFKYVRNFMPWQPEGLHCSYRYKQRAFRQWRNMYHNGELDSLQAAFFEPSVPEKLYNLAEDPFETRNLANDPRYAGILDKMRDLLKKKMISEGDLGLIPEGLWVQKAADLEGYKAEMKDCFPKYFDAADLQCHSYSSQRRKLKKALCDTDPIVRWWAMSACCTMGEEASPLVRKITSLLNDENCMVKALAATYLALFKDFNPTETYKACLKESESLAHTVMILNNAATVHDLCPEIKLSLPSEHLVHDIGWTQDRIKYINN